MDISDSLKDRISKYEDSIVMVEIPVEEYLTCSMKTVKTLIEGGYGGVYVSFQRPFKNLLSMMETAGIDTDSVVVVDVAGSVAGEGGDEDSRHTHISSKLDIDELVRAIYTSMDSIEGNKKFILIDSLTTITLYKPLSEVMRLSAFLVESVRRPDSVSTMLVLNVAKDLSQKSFIKDIALNVDEVIGCE